MARNISKESLEQKIETVSINIKRKKSGIERSTGRLG